MHAGVDVVADFLTALAGDEGRDDADREEQPADRFKAEVLPKDQRNGDREEDEAGDAGADLLRRESLLAHGSALGDFFAHDPVRFDREARFGVLLDAGGIHHHVGDRNDDRKHHDDGAKARSGEDRKLGDLLPHADRPRNRDAEGEADAGPEERHGGRGHAVVAEAVEKRQEYGQVGKRQFRHADEGGEKRRHGHEDRGDEHFLVAHGLREALHAEVDEAGALEKIRHV